MPSSKYVTLWPWQLTILSVVVLAFGLRFYYLTLYSYHMDEYFTLAASKLIAETGIPRYPTGLFYDPGLPFSYLDGLLFRWFGFNEALGRWPSVLFGTLAVVTIYWLGLLILRSSTIGLLAALFLALNVDAIEWSGRARMITLAQWLALVSVGWLWLSLTRSSVRYRLGFALCYALTLLTHFSTVVLLPAWVAAIAGLIWINAVPITRTLMRDGFITLLTVGLALSSGVIFQPPPSVAFQTSNQGLAAKVGELGSKFLQIPSDINHAWKTYIPYFFDQPHTLLTALVIIGLTLALVRRRQDIEHQGRREATQGVVYLGILLITTLGVLTFIIAPHWQRSRYLVMQVLGIFYLLSAYGLIEVVDLLKQPLSRHFSPLPLNTLPLIGAIFLLWPFLQPLAWSFDIGYIGWNRYDLAAKHVRDNLSEGDKIMTMHPPVGQIYLEQSDYYLVQSSPKLIVRPDGNLGDRYTGARWLETADQLQTLLAAPERLWLITQEFWLFNSYDAYLQQQILQRMDKQWGEGGVWALTSRPDTWPLARDIDVPLDGQYENGVHLVGYTAQPKIINGGTFAPGGVIWLTLFWQGEYLPNDLKVFVHLRNADNTTIAQADHIIYDGKVPSSRWSALFENDATRPGGVIRDGATLMLPSDLAPGIYRLLVGFYHPETFARVGVVADVSGEAAVIVAEFKID